MTDAFFTYVVKLSDCGYFMYDGIQCNLRFASSMNLRSLGFFVETMRDNDAN